MAIFVVMSLSLMLGCSGALALGWLLASVGLRTDYTDPYIEVLKAWKILHVTHVHYLASLQTMLDFVQRSAHWFWESGHKILWLGEHVMMTANRLQLMNR